ncbi:hypothetical protein NN561_007136 [Cricetulus griseus]
MPVPGPLSETASQRPWEARPARLGDPAGLRQPEEGEPNCRAVAGEGGRGAVTAWPLAMAAARGYPLRPQASCRGQERCARPLFCTRDQRNRHLGDRGACSLFIRCSLLD